MLFVHQDNGDDETIPQGTSLSVSTPGGCRYTRNWCAMKFGGVLPLPMDYFTTKKCDITFNRHDTMPGMNMRAYLQGRGVEYMEATIFMSWEKHLDVYQRSSQWVDDIYNHYEIGGRTDPITWKPAKRWIFKGQIMWSYEEMMDTASSIGESIPTTLDDQVMCFIGLVFFY